MIDAVCKIAMMLIKEKQAAERVFAALDTQFAIVKRAVKNSGRYGHYELRLMLRICYSGTVALRYDRPEVVEKALSLVKEFEDAQRGKSNDAERLPSLLDELLQWRETVMGHSRSMVLDNVDEVAASLVTSTEVNKFIAQAWKG